MARQTLPWSELRAGLLIIAALTVLAIAILAVGEKSKIFNDTYTLYTRFDQVMGLNPAAPVWLAGVDVGHVTTIRFVEDPASDRPRVDVRMNIAREYQDLIRADSTATIEGKGLLGDKIILISVGSQSRKVLPEGSEIPSEKPADISSVVAEASETIKNLTTITADIAGVTNDMSEGRGSLGMFIKDQSLYSNLNETTANLARLTDKLGKTDGSLIKLLNDPKLYDEMTSLVQELRTGEGTLAKLVQDPDLYNEARGTLEQAKNVVSRVNDVVTKAEQGEGNVGKLVSDEELYKSLNDTVKELRDLIADIKENPGKYVKVSVF